MTKREIIEIAVFTVALVALAALVGISAKVYSDKHPSEPSSYIYEYETINVTITEIDIQTYICLYIDIKSCNMYYFVI